jgi:hypothetical protein
MLYPLLDLGYEFLAGSLAIGTFLSEFSKPFLSINL